MYIDEVGNDDNMVVQHGWSEKGKRSYAEQSGSKTKRLSIVAGYNYQTKEIYAPFEFEGYTDTHLFNGWFGDLLCPELPKNSVVILDNARFHHSYELDEIAEKAAVKLLYLPPYSPDLNPIEKFWANLKRNIRKVVKKFDKFQDAVTFAFNETISG